VVAIPVSVNAPHIAKDKKYYKRYNFESVAMEEYEIRNLYLRRQNSKLEIDDLRVISKRLEEIIQEDNDYLEITVQLSVKNIGNFPEDYYKVSCTLNSGKGLTLTSDSKSQIDITALTDKWIVSSTKRPPLFPDEVLSVIHFKLQIINSLLPFKDKLNLEVKLFYPGGYDIETWDLSEKINFLYQGINAYR